MSVLYANLVVRGLLSLRRAMRGSYTVIPRTLQCSPHTWDFLEQLFTSQMRPKIHSYYFALISAYLREGHFFALRTLGVCPWIYLHAITLPDSCRAQRLQGLHPFRWLLFHCVHDQPAFQGPCSRETRGKHHSVFLQTSEIPHALCQARRASSVCSPSNQDLFGHIFALPSEFSQLGSEQAFKIDLFLWCSALDSHSYAKT